MKTKISRPTKSKQQNKNLLKKFKQTLEEMRPLELWKHFMTNVMRPGQALVTYFIKPSGLTLDQMAKKAGMSEQDINEIIEDKRPITPEIASHFERCFGWPAQALDAFQLLYDMEKQAFGDENFLDELKMHLLGQEIFLAYVEGRLKGIKSDRACVKRRLHAKLRSRQRIRVPKK
jgi:addiction module HigA family antidote